ncbi:MAG TPA: hypothetical protein VFK57_24440 [Vicinamibacterales bacterium]|nr:hypothetical protein [Vicinamibacterales bacterium]
MRHLSPSEFVDLADGSLPRDRAAHAEGCEACRAQAAAVRDALRLAGSAPVPEPSPLFWDHLSARVREAVAGTRPSPGSGWGFGFQPIAAALAIGVLVFSIVLLSRAPRNGQPSRIASAPAAPSGPADDAVDHAPDPVHAAEWAVLTAAAEDLHFDEAQDAGIAVPAATVDRAVTQLTRDELSELQRLLESELKRAGN